MDPLETQNIQLNLNDIFFVIFSRNYLQLNCLVKWTGELGRGLHLIPSNLDLKFEKHPKFSLAFSKLVHWGRGTPLYSSEWVHLWPKTWIYAKLFNKFHFCPSLRHKVILALTSTQSVGINNNWVELTCSQSRNGFQFIVFLEVLDYPQSKEKNCKEIVWDGWGTWYCGSSGRTHYFSEITFSVTISGHWQSGCRALLRALGDGARIVYFGPREGGGGSWSIFCVQKSVSLGSINQLLK